MSMIMTGGKKVSPSFPAAEEVLKAGTSIPMFVEQCETIEKLKKHLLAASSSNSSDDNSESERQNLRHLSDNYSSSDEQDEMEQEVAQTMANLRKRLEAKLDEHVAKVGLEVKHWEQKENGDKFQLQQQSP